MSPYLRISVVLILLTANAAHGQRSSEALRGRGLRPARDASELDPGEPLFRLTPRNLAYVPPGEGGAHYLEFDRPNAVYGWRPNLPDGYATIQAQGNVGLTLGPVVGNRSYVLDLIVAADEEREFSVSSGQCDLNFQRPASVRFQVKPDGSVQERLRLVVRRPAERPRCYLYLESRQPNSPWTFFRAELRAQM